MINEIKCEKCGTIMGKVNQEHTQGMACPNCGYGLVTSFFEPIDEDQIIYKLNIDNYPQIPAIEVLKAIAKVVPQKNLLQIRNEIIVNGYTLTGKARKIAETAKILKEGNVIFTITPAFPYKY